MRGSCREPRRWGILAPLGMKFDVKGEAGCDGECEFVEGEPGKGQSATTDMPRTFETPSVLDVGKAV